MKINKDSVVFEKQDMAFVEKFGFFEATEMVLDYKAHNNLPFFYDVNQLATFFGITKKELFEITKHPYKQYRKEYILKSSGKERILYIPNIRLANIQKHIYQDILKNLPVSEYATAYIPKKSLKDGALPHCNKKYLLKLDITDFFGSISFEKIYSCAFNTKYYPKFIGYLLTALCTKDDCLPQGAATSPALSNIVMKPFDDFIGLYCKKHNITYTRYCDDMTFSADFPLYHIYQKVKAMLENDGFELNERKTKFLKQTQRQSVTGITVNQKPTVSREYKRKTRQEVYYLLKYGAENAVAHGKRFDFIKNNEIDHYKYFCHLKGKVGYILEIEPENLSFAIMNSLLHRYKQLFYK